MKYLTPEMDRVILAAADVITTSTGGNQGGNQGGNKGEFDDEEV